MKRFVLPLLFLSPLFAFAQLKQLAEGPVFTEPEDGCARVIMMKNGNTAYLRITKKDGIDVRLYDPQHKEVAVKTLEPEYGKLKNMTVEGVYDIAGNLTAFVSESDGKTPTLYRVVIDGQNGVLKEQKTIATLNDMSMGQGYAVAFGNVPMPDFITRKDPASDNYGVVRYNTFESERTKRVELIQYDGSGTETARNFLSSPDAKYKFTQILDFVVKGKEAYALLYSYNTPSSGGAANELLFATVKDGAVSYANIGKSMTRRIDDGILRYNPVTNNFIFITSELAGVEKSGFGQTTKRFTTQFNIIDPSNPTIKRSVDFRRSSIAAKYRKVFKDDENGFGGMPEQLYINADGSYTLLMEEITQITRSNGAGMGSHAAGLELGSAAVITFNEDGTERSTVLIPKLQTTMAGMFDGTTSYITAGSFYIATRENGAVPLSAGNQFKSLVYWFGKNKSYVMLNDVEENNERIQKGKLVNVRGVGDCKAWTYDMASTISPALPIPQRNQLFEQERSRDRNLALFNLSDFDREHGVFATLKLEKGNGVKMVWIGE